MAIAVTFAGLGLFATSFRADTRAGSLGGAGGIGPGDGSARVAEGVVQIHESACPYLGERSAPAVVTLIELRDHAQPRRGASQVGRGEAPRFLDAAEEEQPPNAEKAHVRAVDAIAFERILGRVEEAPGQREIA